MPEVWFARINRRPKQGQTFDESDFAGDIERLAAVRSMTFVQRTKEGERRWFAGDLQTTSDGAFLTGRLGFSEKREDLSFDPESWSWDKGERAARDTGSDRSVVAFAVDLDNDGRWVAFMTAPRLRADQFRPALERCLGEAALAANVLGAAWNVDYVVSPSEIREWIELNPAVCRLERVVRMTNPGKDLDHIRRQLRDMHADSKTEVFTAPRGGILDTASPVIEESIDELDQGFSRLKLEARGPGGRGRVKFNSQDKTDKVTVDDPGGSSEAQRETVLGHLASYVRRRRDRWAR